MDNVNEKQNIINSYGEIDKYIPDGIVLTESQLSYLSAAIDLLTKKDHVKMVDVARYMNKSTGSTVDALRRLEKKGVLAINEKYEISLLYRQTER